MSQSKYKAVLRVIICGKKSLACMIPIYHKCKEEFLSLQSIGIIAIKSSETRAVIYTCRYRD